MSHIIDAHVAYIKAIADLSRDKVELLERVKRLEEAGDAMDKSVEPFVLTSIDDASDEGPIPMSEVSKHYEITYDDNPPTAGDHVAMDRARKDWRKAKEAKL